jgi:hypothetical protein
MTMTLRAPNQALRYLPGGRAVVTEGRQRSRSNSAPPTVPTRK